ncbi:hypothetical protein OG599_17875 [Streptomyces sp. NBC_01335]|uniref:hypothetical protein n=1 Tax=Streptomyces sp. NBC_01335 TaxID=2903828 RepID=UPI002E11CC9D|nr:hypothetical protein OG599_17875 [Streptomyces sp. NBC_01335]
MAWNEWEQIKSHVGEQRSASMRLNQLPADQGTGGKGSGDFVAHQDDLGAVGHEAFVLHSRLGKQADIAGAGMDKTGAGSTMQAAATLKSHHFTLGATLETTVSVWDGQMKALLQACAHISNHLDYSKALHAHDDALIGASLRQRNGEEIPVSRLNEYFK